MKALDSSMVTAAQIKAWTAKDPILAQVQDMILQGKSLPDSKELQPFKSRWTELSIHDGCILWGTRVVVPPAGQTRMIEELRESHPGICRMKSLARSYVWWPGMDHDLELKVRACEVQAFRPCCSGPPMGLAEKALGETPSRDYAGPLFGKMYLVVIDDAFSKWLDVKVVSTAMSSATIEHLRSSSWIARSLGYRQRYLFYQCRVSEFYKVEWNTTHSNCPVLSCFKWSS